MNQALIESLYSHRIRNPILRESIYYEFDHNLSNWLLRAYIQLDKYVNGSYYESKAQRIKELVESFDKIHPDRLFVEILHSVIRGGKDQTIQTCIGHLLPFMPHKTVLSNIKTASELLYICSNTSPKGLYEIVRDNKAESPMVKVKYWPVIKQMFGDQLEWIDSTYFNPPLIEPPLEVIDNTNCGYHSFKETLLLGKETQHEGHVDYETINILNSFQWRLDKNVLQEPEVPSKSLQSFDEVKNFQNHCKTARKLYKVFKDRPFWLTWQYDSRGRMYSHGYHINFQSYEYKKALLNLDHYEHLTT